MIRYPVDPSPQSEAEYHEILDLSEKESLSGRNRPAAEFNSKPQLPNHFKLRFGVKELRFGVKELRFGVRKLRSGVKRSLQKFQQIRDFLSIK